MERRQISLVQMAMRRKAWIILIPLVIGIILGAVAIARGMQALRLASDGVVAAAVVVERETRVRTDSDGDTSTTYYLTYRFTPANGAPRTDRRAVGYGFFNSVQVGQVLPVRYLPDDPSVAEIEPGSLRSGSVTMGLFAGLLLIGTIGFAAWFGRSALRMIRAARQGEIRPARVLSRQETKVSVNGQPQWELHWRDATGQMGKSLRNRLDRLIDTPDGSTITVYVDPRTGESFWEEDIAPR